MKKKSSTIAVSICMLILTITMTTIYVASPNQTATVSIYPSTITGPPPDVGENFTVSIKIEDVTDFYTYAIGLSWSPTVLECLNWTFDDSFFPTDISVPGEMDNVEGRMEPPFGATLTGDAGVNGSGTLATVKFRVVGYGESWINFTDCDLLPSYDFDRIPRNLVNATFKVSPSVPERKVPWLGIIVGLVVVVVIVFVYIVMRRRR